MIDVTDPYVSVGNSRAAGLERRVKQEHTISALHPVGSLTAAVRTLGTRQSQTTDRLLFRTRSGTNILDGTLPDFLARVLNRALGERRAGVGSCSP